MPRPAAVTVGPLIGGDGTPESAWAAWPELGVLPLLEVTGAAVGGGPLVVAPHPDDEVLGCGGLLAQVGGAVVAVTDGEASHPGSTVHTGAELAVLRRAETASALAALGRAGTAVQRLSHPDGGIDEARLAGELEQRLTPGRWCLVTWSGDGHPDHEAAGRAAALACARSGARLVQYPVWTWHWARPGDPRVPWARARRFPLSARVGAAKRAAIGCFRTQVGPVGSAPADAAVLPPAVVARFTRPFEVFLTGDVPSPAGSTERADAR